MHMVPGSSSISHWPVGGKGDTIINGRSQLWRSIKELWTLIIELWISTNRY